MIPLFCILLLIVAWSLKRYLHRLYLYNNLPSKKKITVFIRNFGEVAKTLNLLTSSRWQYLLKTARSYSRMHR